MLCLAFFESSKNGLLKSLQSFHILCQTQKNNATAWCRKPQTIAHLLKPNTMSLCFKNLSSRILIPPLITNLKSHIYILYGDHYPRSTSLMFLKQFQNTYFAKHKNGWRLTIYVISVQQAAVEPNPHHTFFCRR